MATRVYIVFVSGYDSSSLLGIYTTPELAVSEMEKWVRSENERERLRDEELQKEPDFDYDPYWEVEYTLADNDSNGFPVYKLNGERLGISIREMDIPLEWSWDAVKRMNLTG